MQNLQPLLTSITRLIKRHKTISQEKHKNGESFNTFNILNLWTDEVRLHSAFIAELLNKDGSHGMGSTFLQSFCELLIHSEKASKGEDTLSSPIENLNYSKTEVYKEYFIGAKTASRGGRIDILVSDGKYALIIENKLAAKDQNKQLIRYNNYGKETYSTKQETRHCVIYLTLDGDNASDKAVSKTFTHSNYIKISYRNTILQWLQQCAQLAYNKPLVRESIIQYTNLIKQITNQDFDMKTEEKMLKILCEKENIESVMSIISQRDAIIEEAVKTHLSPELVKLAEKYDLDLEEKFEPYYGNLDYWIKFKRNNWSKSKYLIFMFDSSKLRDFNWGFHVGNRTFIEQLTCFDKEPTKDYPYGWSYSEDFLDWNDSRTFAKVINGELAKYIDKCLESFNEVYKE